MTKKKSKNDDRLSLKQQYKKYRSGIEAARKKIWIGFCVAMALSVTDLLMGILFAGNTDPALQNVTGMVLVDAIILLGLGIGTLINNRFFAVSLPAYVVIGRAIALGMGILPPFMVIISLAAVICFCRATIATFDYYRLQTKEKFWKSYMAGDKSLLFEPSIAFPFIEAITKITRLKSNPKSNSQSHSPASEREQLVPCKELITLCGGDRNQAMWLLAQIKIKNPHKGLEWYNAEAIGQISDELLEMQDRNY